VDGLRQVITAQSATSIAVNNQNIAGRRAARGNFPADDLAGRIFSGRKTVAGGDGFDHISGNFCGKINQAALKNQHRQNDEQISDDEQLQHTKHPPPKAGFRF
jgi:hypothetical protein